MLEYQLESLTSRSQEHDFEEFARQLLMKEVCPNLLPHTGPTGGGDSKVDSETYPVAEALAYTWVVGDGTAAGERWAFAFSAKKAWRPKLNSDVKKIAETKRGYQKAFFVTNQYVPDKLRAQVEAELSKKHKLDVRIFDRTWILDRVFTNHREDLAIETLHLQVSLRSAVKQGPQDLEAEQELTEVEARIKAAAEAKDFGFLFTEDCLKAAKIARNLERPRTEVEGLFARATRAAAEHSPPLRFAVAYDEAWTSYWWFEDFSRFNELYPEAEQYVPGTDNPYEIERLHNLWVTLNALVHRGVLTPEAANLPQRTTLLAGELDRLGKVEGRPSTKLHARTLRVQMDLMQHLFGGDSAAAEADLRKLKGMVRECEGLIGFPFEPLVNIVTEMGEVCGGLPAYGELFETVVEVSSKRDGDASAARLLLKRGAAQLKADEPNDAIRTLGRSLSLLYKHETRGDMVQALGLCAAAYEELGLLWAARGTMLNAASLATAEFWKYSDVTTLQAQCYKRLKWIELQLGRLPHTLAWHDVDRTVRHVLIKKGYDQAQVMADELTFGLVLGILLLRSEMDQLKALVRLPDKLIELNLEPAAAALWFALGFDKFLPKELADDEARKNYFLKWVGQPAGADLPSRPVLYDAATVEMSSRVLGCRITVTCENQSPCLEVAESLLAAVESLLATTDTRGFMTTEPKLGIEVVKVSGTAAPFAAVFSDPEGVPHLRIVCGDFNAQSLTVEEHQAIKDRLLEILAKLVARLFLVGDPEKSLTRILRDDRAMERALHFTSSFITVSNVLGNQPKHAIAAWTDSSAEAYAVTRTQVWDHAERTAPKPPRPARKAGRGKPPPELGRRNVKHTELEMVSVIRNKLWDQAKWRAMAFFLPEDGASPPIIGLGFLHGEAAGQIFAAWAKELGPRDTSERIRITIMRGISRTRPLQYRVVISANMETAREANEGGFFLMMNRRMVMNPSSSQNLDNFVRLYQKFGCFFLCHAVMADLSSPPEPVYKPSIAKREIVIKDAWATGPDDPDIMALEPEDDPLIPPGQSDALVKSTLQRLREMESGSL